MCENNVDVPLHFLDSQLRRKIHEDEGHTGIDLSMGFPISTHAFRCEAMLECAEMVETFPKK